MKQQVSRFLLAIAIIACWQVAFSQDLERDRYSQLDNFLNYLNTKGINDADSVITKTETIVPICEPLGNIVKQFKMVKSESINKINEKLQRRSQLDLSVQVSQVEGTVESQTKGYSIINSKGSLFAVRIKAPIGSTYKGYVKRGDGTVSYKPLGGSSQTLQTYLPASGGSPQEHYSSMTKEVSDLLNKYNDFWEKFKTECTQVVAAELAKVKQTLLEKHYSTAEDLLNKKEYDSALKEFNFVKTLDPNFKDVDQKLELANNKNNIVRQSNVYNIVNSKQNRILLGTSNGIFESLNSGKTWQLKALEGKMVSGLHAQGNAIIVYNHTDGVIQYSPDLGNTWKKLNIWYRAKYGEGREFQVNSLPFQIRRLLIIPYETSSSHIIFMELYIKKGKYQISNKTVEVKPLPFGGFEGNIGRVEDYNNFRIPEKYISPDGGKNWIAFWKFLGSNVYYSEIGSEKEINQLIDNSRDFSEEPEDAIKKVISNLTDKRKLDKSQIKIRDYSFENKLKKEDNDRVLVLTNYGLFKTCWDCKQIEEITFPKEGKTPVSVFSDNSNPNLIMIGFEGQGLLISRDGGLTWEGI